MPELESEYFDEYISLGDNCEAGLQFWRINYHEGSIFRFSIIDSEDLTNLIRSNFKNIFLKENLNPAPVDYMVRDTKTNIALHSALYPSLDKVSGKRFFRNDYDFDEVYREEKRKVDYLVEKWRELVSSPKRVLYFIKRNQLSNQNDAEMVLETFLEIYPEHNFIILYIQPESLREPDWEHEKLHNVYVDFLAPYDNSEKGADAKGWDKLFTQYPLKKCSQAGTSSDSNKSSITLWQKLKRLVS